LGRGAGGFRGDRGMAARHRLSGISRRLLAWYRKAHRDLPWRRTSDPYRVWVSEIMLQQTRAQAAIPYYQRFLERFPTVDALAAAGEVQVLALWSGLGYYSRARNLWRAARRIAAAGEFPRDYDSLRALPGVGDYTAAAIASIAFQLPYAAVDGNVMRVAARVENDAADIGAARTRERFRGMVQQWLDRRNPGEFNQALMELGAAVCLPQTPLCAACPLAEHCQARAEGTVVSLPVKLRKTAPIRIDGRMLVVRKGRRVLLLREPLESGRMAGFWRLPGPEDLPHATVGEWVGEFRHTITHHHYTYAVFAARLGGAARGVEFRWLEPAQLAAVPLSTAARKALKLAGVA